MFNIHIEPYKRLFALQISFCALAIVLLMQVGSRLGQPVILSGQVNPGSQYGPASGTNLHPSPAPGKTPACRGRRIIKKGKVVCINSRIR